MKSLSNRFNRRRFLALGSAAVAADIAVMHQFAQPSAAVEASGSPSFSIERIRYRTVQVEGLEIFYREAGNPQNPTVLLLHGFPTSSHMFRNLM